MALPVTLPLHDDEAAIDLVARLAAANGYPSLRDFLHHTEISAQAIIAGDDDALSVVSEWSKVPVTSLSRLSVQGGGAGATWRMGKATFNKDMRPGRTMRFCAMCVMEDRERETGRMGSRAYRRSWWSVKGIDGCCAHGIRLAEVTLDADADIHDFSYLVNTNFAVVETAASTAEPGRQLELDRFMIGAVLGAERQDFLGQLDTHVAAEFCRYLGEFLRLHGVEEFGDGETDVRDWGFRLAAGGEDEIRRVVAAVADRERPMAKFFEQFLGRPMVRWFRRNLLKAAYRPLVDLVQDILERAMPFGEGQVILKPVMARHLYCVNSAHADFGLNKDRIRALMKANDPGFRDGFVDASTFFPAGTLRPILEAAAGTMTSIEAAAALGIHEQRLRDLLEAGILHQVETRSGERAFARIETAAVDSLTLALSKRMTVVAEEGVLSSISVAARAAHRTFSQIVSMILDGRAKAVIVPGDGTILQRARVDVSDLRLDSAKVAEGEEGLMRGKDVELALGTTTSTVNDLIARGFLRQRIVRRATGHTVKFVERKSLEEFEADYASLSAIAKSLCGHRRLIREELESLGIKPIFKPEGFNARFYRKTDLARVGYM